jgi:hypothetical protein
MRWRSCTLRVPGMVALILVSTSLRFVSLSAQQRGRPPVRPAAAPAPAAAAPAPVAPQFDPKLYEALKWHNIGPDRGGRSTAVAGSAARPLEFYFGATGGGL